MSAQIIPFQPRAEEPEGRHWTGPAKCVGCGHRWVAVAPVGTVWLDCPSCLSPKGHAHHAFAAPDGAAVLVCNTCPSEALEAYIHAGRAYVMCMGCGADLTEAFYDV